MTYHTPARTSADFIQCITRGRQYAEELTAAFNNNTDVGDGNTIEVFTYSVFYVFYEQYLTIVKDAVMNLSVCVLAVTFITTLMLGNDYKFILFNFAQWGIFNSKRDTSNCQF